MVIIQYITRNKIFFYDMLQKYKKQLLISFVIIALLGSLCFVSFFAFKYGRSNQETGLITSTLALKTEGSPTLVPTTTTHTTIYPTTFITVFPKNFPTNSLVASPTINTSPIPTATPKPTGTLFTIMPLVVFHPSETQVLEGNASLDGYRSSNNGGSNTVEIWIGRNNIATFRGFVSFDLKSLPSNITIEKATLKMRQMGIVGKPYIIGGNVVVDHLDYGTSLDATDYNRAAIKTHIGVLSDNDTFEEKNLEVTDSVKNDLYYKRGRSQYRLRFATETIGGKSSGDIVYFDPEENLYQNHQPPQLEITFKKN